VISHTGAAGGSNEVIVSLLRNLPAGVRPVCAFLSQGPAVGTVRDMGLEALVVDAGRSRDVWRIPPVVYALAQIIRSRGTDVVFAHSSKAQIYASPAATMVGVPNLWYSHELPGDNRSAPGNTRALQELAWRLPTVAIMCSSDFVADRLSQRRPGTRVHRVYPGVRTDGVPPRVHTADGDVRIAVIGRLQRWKRVELALEAMRLVIAEQPRARMRIVGGARADYDADYPDALRARADELGIAHAVEFAGDVADLEAQLAGADIVLHVADREAYGLVLVQALLRAIPIIVPPLGGGAEIIGNGIGGVVVDPTDSSSLARVLLDLCEDPARRNAMGDAGRARALERFDERVTAAEAWARVQAAASSAPPVTLGRHRSRAAA
jgi:glycosyltransferase involved in cell wall biosynthesis